MKKSTFLALFLSFFASQLSAQFIQQGSKIATAGTPVEAYQGISTALSADGKTAIIGGSNDLTGIGSAWIYTRTGTTWTQFGNKLIGTFATGKAARGSSVAMSADGNTALVGGFNDSANPATGSQGAVWVFVRTDTTFRQQGLKLVGTGNISGATQGSSVALSADGNTALVGGPSDDGAIGAVWVFTRTGTTWTQQGNKLVGTGNVGSSAQGISVALSADGNTALVGGYGDNGGKGAVWVFTRNGTTWTQQGNKLVGSGGSELGTQGYSVALSADGNTALVGGYFNDDAKGGAWVFTRTGTTWTQQGSRLFSRDTVGAAAQGYSVALSADGNTAAIGGVYDNNEKGAAWIYTRSGTTWTQLNKLVGTGSTGTSRQGWSVSLSGNGNTALVGAPGDNGERGAVWVYQRSGTPTQDVSNRKEALKIYPSVTSGFLTIETSENVDYQIVNMVGQVVRRGKTVGTTINVADLPKGIYVLTAGQSQAKFIKQ